MTSSNAWNGSHASGTPWTVEEWKSFKAWARENGAQKIGESIVWTEDGQYHRLDGPAIVDYTGHEAWYRNGKRHREDGGPAFVGPDGHKEWFVNGQAHREEADGPAAIWPDGREAWYRNGVPVRDTYGIFWDEGVSVSEATGEDRQTSRRHSAGTPWGYDEWHLFREWALENGAESDLCGGTMLSWRKKPFHYIYGGLGPPYCREDTTQPAFVSKDGRAEWYRNGDHHREDGKPAIIGPNGYRAWYRNGTLTQQIPQRFGGMDR
jgi:hypothetical protein